MASVVYLGYFFGKQDKIYYIHQKFVNKSMLNDGLIAIIAKSNRIAGITAKE